MADKEGFEVPEPVVVIKDGKSTVWAPGAEDAPKRAVKKAEPKSDGSQSGS